MLGKIVLQIIQSLFAILVRSTVDLMFLLVIAKNQPCEIKPTQIRLIAQRREILAEVILVEAPLRLLKLYHLTLLMLNQRVKQVNRLVVVSQYMYVNSHFRIRQKKRYFK
ncbi:hypothetical protein [uncultured Muribaculum sp.]|uniref:hypothetical protein n=1 Tax=uncultured Muribaculum sp. TaxID=1918613 RepID=UPI00264877ED|nr:hypothetical protein [uncultured Muribaculum sp.]